MGGQVVHNTIIHVINGRFMVVLTILNAGNIGAWLF